MKQYLLPLVLLLASCSSTVAFREGNTLSKEYSAFLQLPKEGATADDPYPYTLVALPVGECRNSSPHGTYTFTGSDRSNKQRVYLQHSSHGVSQEVTYAEFYPFATKEVVISDKGITVEKK